MANGVYGFQCALKGGQKKSLDDYRGKVLLIVNTASKCGFTPQYRGLESLHREYAGRGLRVLGFPCNQFGRQEPGNAAEIRSFCTTQYDVNFPLHRKIDVNGSGAHPLYLKLTDEARGLFGTKMIKWNFTKFLVDRNGEVVARFGPRTTPDDLRREIEALL